MLPLTPLKSLMIMEEYVVNLLYNVLVYLHDYVVQLHNIAPEWYSFTDFWDELNLQHAFIDCTLQTISRENMKRVLILVNNQEWWTITKDFTALYHLAVLMHVIFMISLLIYNLFTNGTWPHILFMNSISTYKEFFATILTFRNGRLMRTSSRRHRLSYWVGVCIFYVID